MLCTCRDALFPFVSAGKREDADFSIHAGCRFYDFNSWKLLLRSGSVWQRTGYATSGSCLSLSAPPPPLAPFAAWSLIFRRRRELCDESGKIQLAGFFFDTSCIENIARRTDGWTSPSKRTRARIGPVRLRFYGEIFTRTAKDNRDAKGIPRGGEREADRRCHFERTPIRCTSNTARIHASRALDFSSRKKSLPFVRSVSCLTLSSL